MTEQEWLASEDPAEMLRHLTHWPDSSMAKIGGAAPSDRKLRLFACACCRHQGVWALLSRSRRNLVLAAEQVIEGSTDDLDRDDWEDLYVIGWNQSNKTMPKALQAAILRDIVGNPFRPVSLRVKKGDRLMKVEGRRVRRCPEGTTADLIATTDEHGVNVVWARRTPGDRPDVFSVEPHPWLTPTVLSLAEAAYLERASRWVCARHGIVPESEVYEAEGGGHGHYREPGCWQKAERVEDGTLDPFRLALVADAMEEAGCVGEEATCPRCKGKDYYAEGDRMSDMFPSTCPTCDRKPHQKGGGKIRLPHPILAHLHSPGPHVRGCWALDLVLGKE